MGRKTTKKSTAASRKWEKRLPFTGNFVGMPEDIVIVIMGPTGAGKSTLIQKYTGDTTTDIVGDSMDSCTADMVPHVVKIPELYRTHFQLAHRRLILVDTPGFDDSHVSDYEILAKIAAWLARCYNTGTSVAGIVYMHNITLNRMFGSMKANLNTFTKLCGENSFHKIVIATTQWQSLSATDLVKNAGESRERDMKKKHWTTLLEGGASVMRITDDGTSGKDIIEYLVVRLLRREASGGYDDDPLQIQAEIVDKQRNLPATQAAREMKCSLQDFEKLQQKRKDDQLTEIERQELNDTTKVVKEQLAHFKEPFGDRFKRFFGM